MNYTVYIFTSAVAKEYGFTSISHRAGSMKEAQDIAASFPFHRIVEWKRPARPTTATKAHAE